MKLFLFLKEYKIESHLPTEDAIETLEYWIDFLYILGGNAQRGNKYTIDSKDYNKLYQDLQDIKDQIEEL